MRVESVVSQLGVVCGPSGVGKDAVLQLFLERNKDSFSRVLTDTSRPRREGESENSYRFWTIIQMLMKDDNKDYLEKYEYRPNEWKGTSTEMMVRGLMGRKNIIWEIDPETAAQSKRILLEKITPREMAKTVVSKTQVVYIMAESWEEIERRYFEREPGADRNNFYLTFEKDRKTFEKNKLNYDHIVINRTGKLVEAVMELESVLLRRV